MKRLFIIAAFCGLITGISLAQKVTVYDRSDLQPVAEVTITNLQKTIMVVTDQAGTADLRSFGSHDTLVFTHVAYQPVNGRMDMLKDKEHKVYLTENIIKLDEFVVSANKVEEKKSNLPYTIEVIQAKQIAFNNPQTSASMLEQTGNVFVQQSQLGGGSPVLRGFEANRVLLVLDGVRLNNAAYRAGHLQSVITVDPMMLASSEILYGPGSTIYGSDALGGVISLQTKDPVLSASGKPHVSGDAVLRFSSASLEKTGQVAVNIGLKKWGFLTYFSYSAFDDLREGKTQNPFYGGFGERHWYVDRINGVDSVIQNSDWWVQHPSAYHQYNFLEKVLFQPSRNLRFTLNFQYSNSSDIPRYDRLTEFDSAAGKPVYAQWFYGPQQRLFGSLKADLLKKNAVYDKGSVIIAYQNVEEDRLNRKLNKTFLKNNLETISVISLNADFLKKLASRDDLRYGVEAVYNNVGSVAYNEDINTGEKLYNLATRYADDKAQMFSFAAYASNLWKITSTLNFSQGLRFSYVSLNAAWSDTMMSIMKFPFANTVTQKNSALNGYLGLVFTPKHGWKVSLTGSSGFRAPNIDDLTKVNDSNSKDKLIVVPNPGLEPEYAYNLELGVGKTFLDKVRIEGSGYYTWLRNAIIMAPTTYNGQDSIIYDGVLCQVQSSTNAGQAFIYGFQGTLLAQVTKAFSILSNLTWTVGELNATGESLDHIPPVYGMTSFRLEVKKFKGDFYVMYNGWKHIEDYSPSGEDNQSYATPYGMPAWYTLNLKLSYQINKYVNVEAGCENILDVNYRKFASGISSPGRNFIVALRGKL
jgi:hemoglobin/transferrin/lactoferrin receptor protein